ncbi:ATP-binding cassette domain-containing protein [uncultured Halopseudomonas sp.]|uniref:ATP-binding cassette domain-containing protein n=1 Tax=uncultured Halopseudomonas sp. TaxID=2901193 RepID=UPI0030EEAC22|tara:strand:+ start:13441 stop:14208 length:768 start_codon:yes stop_codon:yes gene_type:complete
MFELKGATFAVNGKTLLQPTHLNFEEGKVHGLIGHNGSGKSTLLKLLARQQQATAGDVLFNGRPVANWGSREYARQVAYLPQHLPATDNLTGQELVEFGRYPWHGLLGRQNALDRTEIARAIALTDTSKLVSRMVNSLSGGERQRVWLAMLLAQKSRFLLLDEPLAALDIAHQVEVLKLVRRLSHDLGLGVIIVLHDINMAARYCDRLTALHGGRVLEQGSPLEMMESDTLEAIYGLPMQIMVPTGSTHPVAIVQ